MARQEARDAVGAALDQMLQATPNVQTLRGQLATGFLQGIAQGPVDLANLGQVGLTLEDVYLRVEDVRQLSGAVEQLFNKELHERRLAYSGLYGKIVETLVKV